MAAVLLSLVLLVLEDVVTRRLCRDFGNCVVVVVKKMGGDRP
jgi:hypothetical protein